MVLKNFLRILKKTFRIKRETSHKRKKPRRKKILRRSIRPQPPRKTRTRKVRRRKNPPRKARGKTAKKLRPLGVVTHYFPKARAAVVELKAPLNIGQPVWLKGKKTDFRQTVGSMQINRKPIQKAGPGRKIGLEVMREVRAGDEIYLSQ